MCYFFGLQINTEKLLIAEPFKISLDEEMPVSACRSGFEYGSWPVLYRNEQSGEIETGNFHWEFIPNWISNEEALLAARKKGVPWLNARCETLLSSKMFGDAARKRRCLIPITHFFEWRHYQPPGAKKPVAYPYCIGRIDGGICFLAGIWQYWTDRSTGELVPTFAVVTTGANSLMAEIHNTKKRQPTLLPADKALEWLDPSLCDQQIEAIAGFRIESDQLFAHPVGKDFRSSANPTETYRYPELPELVY